MDHKREHRTPPLARVMGVGRQQQQHPRRSECTAGWWSTSGKIGLLPLARVMGVGRQQQHCSMVFGTLVGVFAFIVMWSELMMASAISCPLWSSVYECQRVECVFTSSVRTGYGMCVMYCCCCLPTPMALASGGSPMFPLVVHQPASPSIWPAVQSLRRGLSTNPGATMWCVCGCS